VFIASALSNIGTENQASRDSKTQPFCKLGVLVRCLARTRESPAIFTDTEIRLLCTFFVAATVKLQKFVINEPNCSPSEQGSNWQHQLIQASLYSRHIMTSVLRHD